MRKLTLEMHISVDGLVEGPHKDMSRMKPADEIQKKGSRYREGRNNYHKPTCELCNLNTGLYKSA